MTNQLTLGPLCLEDCTSEHEHDICLLNPPADMGSPVLLATVFHDVDAPRTITLVQADAYARLFAAAPDLLDALSRFVTAAKSWHDFHHGSKTVQCDWLCECIPAAEAAIKKATGLE